MVVGSSNLSGSVTVNGTARLENVTASSSVAFSGDCNVYGGTYTGSAQITDAAVLVNTNVSGNAIVRENGWGYGVTYGGTNVIVGGDAEIGSCSTAGVYLQTPHGNNGRSNCDGLGATHSSNIDINSSYSNFTDAQMAWTAIGCSGGGTSNIAPLATATTSYVSSWETIAALNDGFPPANSNDKSHGAYGNWNNPNSTQWVQYTWPSNYNISSVEVYWFDDNGGVLTPTTATLQYYNNATSTWVNYGPIPRVKDANNVLAVTGVTTNQLRVSMLNTTQSTGILEWRVLGTPSTARMAAQLVEAPKIETAELKVTVAPNPVQSVFTVKLSGFRVEEDVNLYISDMQGKVLHQQNLFKQREVKMDKSQLAGASGVYLIRAVGASGSGTAKVILNR
ncbi:T9SS type A sorting domain-containing protein [Chitinophaga sedimenti]|uniref:T9SS type A sorting domain-containing protein n=1 Tax=Chitinophaga sedimenti TaxID=2033606 RepID=UPI003557D499